MSRSQNHTEPLVASALRWQTTGQAAALDVARIASRTCRGPAEVVLFGSGEGMARVIAAQHRRLMQNRPLWDCERTLLSKGSGHVVTKSGTSFAITDESAVLRGALTLGPDCTVSDTDTLHGLCRLLATSLESVPDRRSAPEAILRGIRDAVIVVDTELNVSWASPSTAAIFGRSPLEIVGQPAISLVHPEDCERALDGIGRLSQGNEIWVIQGRVHNGAGGFTPVQATGSDLTMDPDVQGLVLSIRRADEADTLGDALGRLRQITRASLEQMHDGIITTDASGAVHVINAAARSLLGVDDKRTAGQISVEDLALSSADGETISALEHPLHVARQEVVVDRRYFVEPDGERRQLSVSGKPITADDGLDIGAVLTIRDVTEAERTGAELRRYAFHDQLTGLPNRRQLTEHVQSLMNNNDAGTNKQSTNKQGTNHQTGRVCPAGPVAAFLIDLDNFKWINDTYGHRAGDEVIREVATRLQGDLAEHDLLVRLGGDEFVIVTQPDERKATQTTIRYIQDHLGQPVVVDGLSHRVTASIGVAVLDRSELTGDRLLRHADIALYAAKEKGRNRAEIFDSELATAAMDAQSQRELIQDALRKDRVEMHFQAVVLAQSGETVGYEALARIRDAQGQPVSPGPLLDTIAGTALAWEFDRSAFALTCAGAAQIFAKHPGIRVAANFSAVSLEQPELVATVMSTLDTHGISPGSIMIEVTESTAFAAGTAAATNLHRLRATGILLALDDFGTGYSSLAHLRDLPLNAIKVDRSFVKNFGSSADSIDQAIAHSVVSLARQLGLRVVAEGVETEEQLRIAQEMGFTMIQGWYFARAEPLATILDQDNLDQTRHLRDATTEARSGQSKAL